MSSSHANFLFCPFVQKYTVSEEPNLTYTVLQYIDDKTWLIGNQQSNHKTNI
jgi:hypothetical protein